MHHIIDDTAAAALLPALEANMIAFYTAYGRAPGGTVHATSDVVWCYTGIPDPLFNGVFAVRSTVAGVTATIAQLTSTIAARGAPALWWIEPCAQPAQIGSLLEHHGLHVAGDVPGMAIDLSAIDSPPALPADMTIQAVHTADMQVLWARTAALGSGLASDAAEALVRVEATLSDPQYRAQQRYLGFFQDRPIATAALVLDSGVAGIYAVATLPTARRKGIGRMMTLLALLEARQQGYRVGVLQASAMGYPLYKQMGFREVCRYQLYLQSPAAD